MAFDRETLKPKYRLEIGRAGESHAFYIAKSLGMPADMLRRASQGAYGENGSPDIMDALPEQLERRSAPVIQKKKSIRIIRRRQTHSGWETVLWFIPTKDGNCLPYRKMKRACFQVQLQDKKIWINHKRIKLHVPASELYPEGLWDFPLSSKAWRRGKRNTRWSVNTVKEWRELYHPQTDCGIL